MQMPILLIVKKEGCGHGTKGRIFYKGPAVKMLSHNTKGK